MKDLVNKLRLLERKRDLLASSKSLVDEDFVKGKLDVEEYEIAKSFFDFPENFLFYNGCFLCISICDLYIEFR